MAYSQFLAERIRRACGLRRGIEEQSMFGGLGFLLNGNLCVGVWQNFLVARIGPVEGEKALNEEQVTEFQMTGRAIKGWVMVAPDNIEHDEQLNHWIRQADEFVLTLPAK